MPTRREVMVGAVGLAGAGFAGGIFAAAPARSAVPTLTIQPARARIVEEVTEALVSTRPDGPPPVIRLKQNESYTVDVVNGHGAPTAMHWHGLRVPHAMDGVPYLTQPPIRAGERFRYTFSSEDAGTYWYHPHCLTMDQMARGLTGVLIVDEAEDPGFDADISLNLRDFRLDGDGQFMDLWTARGAARGGTLGNVMTANWATTAEHTAPSGGLARVRIAATDVTRIYRLWFDGAPGQIIAMDGHPLRTPVPWPSEGAPLLLSPGQRVDLAVLMPAEEGSAFTVKARAPGSPRTLAAVRAEGANVGRTLSDFVELPANPVPEPDLENAQLEEFVFGWSPQDAAPRYGLCGTLGYTFWSINREPYQGDAAEDLTPLAVLKLGQSYVLRLRNESPNAHPVHLHGLTFRPIRSNKREVLGNWTDTALLGRGETLDVAVLASNPGDWAFHCHIIEHQKTGLAGVIRVE
ncbi:MAG: multicopper oxidase family protein [Pseudomonadota bacterium]